jgi:hypothetical protein
MTCAQWSAVAAIDAACLPAVHTYMTAVVTNEAVVPSAYQPALTAQVNALLTSPCPSPPPPVASPPPAIPSALLASVSSTLAQVCVTSAAVTSHAACWRVRALLDELMRLMIAPCLLCRLS